MHYMLQCINVTPFRAPAPAILHFELIRFRPETSKKLLKTSKISVTDVWFLTSPQHMQYTKNNVQMFLVCHELIC